MQKAIENMEGNLYDDISEIVEAVQARLARKQLAKITDEGHIEYGLIIPQGKRKSFRVTKGQRTKKFTKKKEEEEKDIEWIIKGSGLLSKGTTGSNPLHLGVRGSADQQFGSSISLQSVRSWNTQRDRFHRSNSFDDLHSHGNRSFKNSQPIPDIKPRKSISDTFTAEDVSNNPNEHHKLMLNDNTINDEMIFDQDNLRVQWKDHESNELTEK